VLLGDHLGGSVTLYLPPLLFTFSVGGTDLNIVSINLAHELGNRECQSTAEYSELFYLGDTLAELEFLFSELESPYMNLCLDVGHANTNEGPLAYIQKFGNGNNQCSFP
jgi:hypothetical protein